VWRKLHRGDIFHETSAEKLRKNDENPVKSMGFTLW